MSFIRERIRYGDRTTVARLVPRNKYALEKGWLHVFATNADVTDGWTDVTDEFKARYLG